MSEAEMRHSFLQATNQILENAFLNQQPGPGAAHLTQKNESSYERTTCNEVRTRLHRKLGTWQQTQTSQWIEC